MERVQINGKIVLKRGVLYVITIVHDFRPDIAIFEDLFEAIFKIEIDSQNKLQYKEIVKRKRVQGSHEYKQYQASQYTVLLVPTD